MKLRVTSKLNTNNCSLSPMYQYSFLLENLAEPKERQLHCHMHVDEYYHRGEKAQLARKAKEGYSHKLRKN